MSESRVLTVELDVLDPAADALTIDAVREALARLARAGYVKFRTPEVKSKS
jgi:hypothetical protein